jgi:hypothetical protein
MENISKDNATLSRESVERISLDLKDSCDIPDVFLTQLSSFINENAIKLIPKKQEIYDIVNLFLEKNHSEDPFLIVNLGEIILASRLALTQKYSSDVLTGKQKDNSISAVRELLTSLDI